MSFKNRSPAYRMFSKSHKKHFKGFGSGFTELHAKLHAGMLLAFAFRSRKYETQSRKDPRVKAMRVPNAVSRGRLMQ
jgi:hypothetical protein